MTANIVIHKEQLFAFHFKHSWFCTQNNKKKKNAGLNICTCRRQKPEFCSHRGNECLNRRSQVACHEDSI